MLTRIYRSSESIPHSLRPTALRIDISSSPFIKYRWLTEDERKHASELQVRWYEENLFKENKLAIRDFVHAVHAPVDDIHSLVPAAIIYAE